jgi:hypothetical protein
MSEHSLRAGVHAVAVGEDLVFLDADADRYICLADAAGRAHLDPSGAAVAVDDPEALDQLLGAGLLAVARQGPPRPPRRTAPPPQRSAIAEAYDPPAWRDAQALAHALWDLHRHYRGRPFPRILATARPNGHPGPTPFSAALRAEVDRFHRWSPYAPVPGKCLLRSFMLLRHLQRRGLDGLWVFGVRTWPFHAHCWLQCDDVVLDDQADRVAAYAPILVA